MHKALVNVILVLECIIIIMQQLLVDLFPNMYIVRIVRDITFTININIFTNNQKLSSILNFTASYDFNQIKIHRTN